MTDDIGLSILDWIDVIENRRAIQRQSQHKEQDSEQRLLYNS
jgi:hypothetical protein